MKTTLDKQQRDKDGLRCFTPAGGADKIEQRKNNNPLLISYYQQSPFLSVNLVSYF
jgi:hypothetical protein